MMKRILFITGGIALLLAAIAFALDIPRFAWGILTYGQQRRDGPLVVGDAAPSVVVHDLATGAEAPLSSWIGETPLILIFGSCT
ncbi:MAG: hypothetical protein AAGF97_19450 [Planctomycetota bacterium]